MLGVSDGPRSGLLVSAAIRLGHRLAHPAAGLHRRARFLHRGAGGTQLVHRSAQVYLRISMFWIKIFLDLLRDGRGHRHRHALPVRHELEPLRGRHRQCAVAAVRLRGPDGIFSRGGISRRAAVRTQAGAALGPFRRGADGALGTLFSSFWILSANSWMQTPAGYEIVDGRFFPTDWLQVIFNPSFPFRLAHTRGRRSSSPPASS